MATSEGLAPLQAPLGIHKEFIANQPTTLVMKEKFSFSGDDFSVKTVEGTEVVRCSGTVVSLSGRKEFTSPNGQALFTLRKKHFSIPASWYLEDPNGTQFLQIKGRFSIGKAKLDVIFNNTIGDGSEVTLEVRGKFFDRSADITLNGQPIAKIRREFFNAREIFTDNQTYGVEVAPGVDLALLAAIVVGLDEQRNEK